jgi:hypothetical protein
MPRSSICSTGSRSSRSASAATASRRRRSCARRSSSSRWRTTGCASRRARTHSSSRRRTRSSSHRSTNSMPPWQRRRSALASSEQSKKVMESNFQQDLGLLRDLRGVTTNFIKRACSAEQLKLIRSKLPPDTSRTAMCGRCARSSSRWTASSTCTSSGAATCSLWRTCSAKYSAVRRTSRTIYRTASANSSASVPT